MSCQLLGSRRSPLRAAGQGSSPCGSAVGSGGDAGTVLPTTGGGRHGVADPVVRRLRDRRGTKSVTCPWVPSSGGRPGGTWLFDLRQRSGREWDRRGCPPGA